MTSPLFRNAQRALEEATRRDATVRTLARTLSTVRGSSRNVMRGAKQLMRSIEGTPQVDRYGKISEFVRTQIINEVIRQLGPLGGLVAALLRPQGRSLTQDINQEIDAAAQILQELQGPPDRPAWMPPRTTPDTGRGGKPRGPVTGGTPQAEETFREVTPAGYVDKEVVGRRYRFPVSDPIITGEMIDVQSSNVHSIGYLWNSEAPTKGTLRVRYLGGRGGKGRRNGPGPLYDYFGVHPEVFMAFQQAASKGKFVWDRLRIRGTVSGHRFQYELEDTGQSSYIPRKATRLGQNEYYLRREFRGNQSQLEDEFVQRIGINRHGPQGFVPNRGTPNRGTPNRGRP
jgi:hypothetical protein